MRITKYQDREKNRAWVGRHGRAVDCFIDIVVVGASALERENGGRIWSDASPPQARLAQTIAGESSAIAQYMGKMIIAKASIDDIVNQIVTMRKVRTTALAQFKARANNPKSAKQAEEMGELVKAADASNDAIMTWLAADLFEQATQDFSTSSAIAADMHAKAKEASDFQEQLIQESEKTRKRTSSLIWMALISGSVITIAAAIFGGVILTRGIAIPLGGVVANLEQIAQGDLSKDTPAGLLDRADEIGTLARAMQTMTTALRKMVREISSGIAVLSSSSAELTATSTEMTAGSRNASDKAQLGIGCGRANEQRTILVRGNGH